jgi:hypothetical protein
MKTLRKINTIAFYTTLVLFLTLYLGMLAEIPLGIIQVISAFILTFYVKDKSVQSKRQLMFYWIFVGFELALFLLEEFYLNAGDIVSFSLVIFIPMSIAIYFFIIMRRISDEYEFNKQQS